MGLDIVELIIAVEQKFEIVIPDNEASEFVTVGDLHRCIISKLAMQEKHPCLRERTLNDDEVWNLLSLVITEETGVTKFTKDSRFVADLRLD